MEALTVICMIVGILSIVVWVSSIFVGEEDITSKASYPLVPCLLVLFILSTDTKQDEYVTLEKSSDSEWIKSEKDYRDTTVTRIVILKSGDTVYPTTVYKRVKL